MKKLITALCCVAAMATQAKEISYNVYYSETTKTRGELYLYSERYLGTTDVILEDSHSFQIDRIKSVTPTASPAPSSEWKATTRTIIKNQLPLSEETMMATNLAKKAESVAKQIYRIREIRMNILSGDVEHMPADGKAMQLALEELDKQEEALTSMFVGKSVVKTYRKTISIHVSDQEKAIKKALLRFSSERGPLDLQDQQGEVINLSLIRTTERVLATNQPKKGEPVYVDKITSETSTITYKNKTLYEKTCDL